MRTSISLGLPMVRAIPLLVIALLAAESEAVAQVYPPWSWPGVSRPPLCFEVEEAGERMENVGELYVLLPARIRAAGTVLPRTWCDTLWRVRQQFPGCRVAICTKRGNCAMCWGINRSWTEVIERGASSGCLKYRCLGVYMALIPRFN
jgi:hypothetical protein